MKRRNIRFTLAYDIHGMCIYIALYIYSVMHIACIYGNFVCLLRIRYHLGQVVRTQTD